jgi:hypothetical protein
MVTIPKIFDDFCLFHHLPLSYHLLYQPIPYLVLCEINLRFVPDINECKYPTKYGVKCHTSAKCENHNGAYMCKCGENTIGDGHDRCDRMYNK